MVPRRRITQIRQCHSHEQARIAKKENCELARGKTAMFVAAAISVAIGTPSGAVGGYFGGGFDQYTMPKGDIVISVPSLLMVMYLFRYWP